jgi:uncharacterized protein (TIGR00369 family)
MSELLEMGRAVLAAQPFSVYLRAQLTALEQGRAELTLDLETDFLQQNGFAHGGVIGYLADNSLTFAGGSVLGPNVLTEGYSITYLRPGVGDRLVARAVVVHHSRRRAVCRCDVFALTDGDEMPRHASGKSGIGSPSRRGWNWDSISAGAELGAPSLCATALGSIVVAET